MPTVTPEHMTAVRRLALNDESYLSDVLASYSAVGRRRGNDRFLSSLSDKTRRLVEVAALIAAGSGRSGIDAAVSAAFGAGASPEDIVDVLLSITPYIGSARVVSAAPHIAAAIGYDLDADLEGVFVSGPEGGRVFEG